MSKPKPYAFRDGEMIWPIVGLKTSNQPKRSYQMKTLTHPQFHVFIFAFTLVVGHIANIVQLFLIPELVLSGEILIKAIGIIFFPLGSIMGIIGFF